MHSSRWSVKSMVMPIGHKYAQKKRPKTMLSNKINPVTHRSGANRRSATQVPRQAIGSMRKKPSDGHNERSGSGDHTNARKNKVKLKPWMIFLKLMYSDSRLFDHQIFNIHSSQTLFVG